MSFDSCSRCATPLDCANERRCRFQACRDCDAPNMCHLHEQCHKDKIKRRIAALEQKEPCRVEARIAQLQQKMTLTRGEQIEIEMLLERKWGKTP